MKSKNELVAELLANGEWLSIKNGLKLVGVNSIGQRISEVRRDMKYYFSRYCNHGTNNYEDYFIDFAWRKNKTNKGRYKEHFLNVTV
jgi:hypothetical protein